MRIKRLILSILTIVTIAFISFSLISSVTQPQIQSRLELYQTNLLLHAGEWEPKDLDSKNFKLAQFFHDAKEKVLDNWLQTCLVREVDALKVRREKLVEFESLLSSVLLLGK